MFFRRNTQANQPQTQPAPAPAPQGMDKTTLNRIQQQYNINEFGREIGAASPSSTTAFTNLPPERSATVPPEAKGNPPTALEQFKETFRKYIQNTYNTIKFFEYIQSISRKDQLKYVKKMIQCTKDIEEAFHKVYQRMLSEQYQVEEIKIDTDVSLDDALKWALQEELFALKDFIDVNKNNKDLDLKLTMDYIAMNKMCCIHLLQTLQRH